MRLLYHLRARGVDPFDPQKKLTLRRRRQRWVWVYSYRVRHGVSRVRRLNDIVGG